jgi:hypothetical protein
MLLLNFKALLLISKQLSRQSMLYASRQQSPWFQFKACSVCQIRGTLLLFTGISPLSRLYCNHIMRKMKVQIAVHNLVYKS